MLHIKVIEIDEIEQEVAIDFELTADGVVINHFTDADGNSLDLWRSQALLNELEEIVADNF